jgi:hypothetical protein
MLDGGHVHRIWCVLAQLFLGELRGVRELRGARSIVFGFFEAPRTLRLHSGRGAAGLWQRSLPWRRGLRIEGPSGKNALVAGRPAGRGLGMRTGLAREGYFREIDIRPAARADAA